VSDNDDYITVDSLDQAEKIILEHINNGENYRDISQITFSINGTIKRFNPSQISKIKGKNEQSQAQNRHDSDKCLVYKMFRKGKNPTDVVIETGLNFEYVKKAYEEYLEFEEQELVPKYWLDNLEKFAGYVSEVSENNRLGDIHYAFSVAKESHLELEKFVFTCSKCDEDARINGKALEDAQQYLSSKWKHTDCS